VKITYIEHIYGLTANFRKSKNEFSDVLTMI